MRGKRESFAKRVRKNHSRYKQILGSEAESVDESQAGVGNEEGHDA